VPFLIESKSSGRGGARERHMSAIERRLRISESNTFFKEEHKGQNVTLDKERVDLAFWNTIRAASPVLVGDRNAARTALKAWASFRRVAISWAANHAF